MRRAIWVIAVGLLFASCGSEGSNAKPSQAAAFATPSPTAAIASGAPNAAKRAFVDAANAACREYARRDEALSEPEKLGQYVDFWTAFIRIGDDLQAMLRKIPVPAADAADISDYLAKNDQQADVLKAALPKIEDAVRKNNQTSADGVIDEAIDEFNRISSLQDPWARSYGLTDCANPPDDNGTSVQA